MWKVALFTLLSALSFLGHFVVAGPGSAWDPGLRLLGFMVCGFGTLFCAGVAISIGQDEVENGPLGELFGCLAVLSVVVFIVGLFIPVHYHQVESLSIAGISVPIGLLILISLVECFVVSVILMFAFMDSLDGI